MFVKGFCNGGFFCVGEGGPSPFPAIPVKGELADGQDLALDLGQVRMTLLVAVRMWAWVTLKVKESI